MTTDRTMPQSLESERALLGGLLLDAQQLAQVSDLVSVGDFYRPAHGRLFKLIQDMDAASIPVEVVSVIERAEAMRLTDMLGGLEYLTALGNNVPSTENLAYYAEQVAERAKRRRLIVGLHEAAERAYDGAEDLADVLAGAEQQVLAVTRQHDTKGWTHVGQAATELGNDLVEQARAPRQSAGVPTGYHALDGMLKGLRPQQLVLLAARPAMGKSSLALNIAESFCSAGIPVGFFSMEMSQDQIARRLLAGRATIPLGRLLSGRMSPAEWARLRIAASQLGIALTRTAQGLVFRFADPSVFPLYIDEAPNLSLVKLSQRAKRLKADHPDLGLLVVDYVQLMAEAYRGQKRQEAVAENFRGLKNLAKELGLPVLALSQLNRELERRPNKRPQLSDLRETGEAEQAADVVTFIYRDDYYNKESLEKGVSEVIVSKQRDGPTGTVKMFFEDCYCRFENLSV